MKCNETTLGNNLRDLRIYGNLCIVYISRFVGVSYQHYRKLERGLVEITVEQLEKLSDLYNVEPYDLLTTPGILHRNDVPFLKLPRKISEKDLEEIAKFNRIVRNYIKMNKLLDKKEQSPKR